MMKDANISQKADNYDTYSQIHCLSQRHSLLWLLWKKYWVNLYTGGYGKCFNTPVMEN